MLKIERRTSTRKPGKISFKVTETKTATFEIEAKGEPDIMRTCPKCGKEYQEHPAISRTDNKTEICPDCGTLEALEAAGISKKAQDAILNEIHTAKGEQA